MLAVVARNDGLSSGVSDAREASALRVVAVRGGKEVDVVDAGRKMVESRREDRTRSKGIEVVNKTASQSQSRDGSETDATLKDVPQSA